MLIITHNSVSDMLEKIKKSNRFRRAIESVSIVIVFIFILFAVFYSFSLIQPPRGHPCKFNSIFNVTKTSDGWVIKGHAWIMQYNESSGEYYKNYSVELSKLSYAVYNVTTGYVYDKGTVKSIKNKTSPIGIIFHDADGNDLLSQEDCMVIPLKNVSGENYPHSGDRVVFSYDGCECASGVELP